MSPELPEPESLTLEGRRVPVVRSSRARNPNHMLDQLELGTFDSVLLLCGGAKPLDDAIQRSPALGAKLRQLLEWTVMPAAAAANSLIITGGTDVGLMALVGQAFSLRPGQREGPKPALVGVVPNGAVEAEAPEARPGYQPDHQAFVFTDGLAWGDETGTMFDLAAAAALRHTRTHGRARPVLTVVINGGEITRQEVLEATARGWPILVFAGSGGFADELALAPHTCPGATIVNLDDDPKQLQGLLASTLAPDPDEEMLYRAWSNFARYDGPAVAISARWRRFELAISSVGLLAVAVALLPSILNDPIINELLERLVILLPIALSTLIAARNRFEFGIKAVFLRSAAEAIRREIYMFRTRAGDYADNRRSQLAARLQQINEYVMTTAANESSLPADRSRPSVYLDDGDDGYSDLDGDQYVNTRMAGQIAYYTAKTAKLEHRSRVLNWGIYISGGIGTALATDPKLAIWIALTTTIAGTITSHLERDQDAKHLARLNLTRSRLDNLWSWWRGLSSTERYSSTKIDRLVTSAEQILEQETLEWVQGMEETLADEGDDEDDEDDELPLAAASPPPPPTPRSPS